MNNEKTTQTAAKDGPHIDAGSLSLEEFRTWIRHRQRNAFRYECDGTMNSRK
ncbi:hypothetical protein [Salmonella enterica]|uniref:hypothetical protein n=1 Tax=Salmonella enterica TaxID=28901 RepID=UPI003D320287